MKRLLDTEWWAEIFQSLNKNRKRSFFTSIGVVWATFLLVLLLGVGIGLEQTAMQQMGSDSRMYLHLQSGCTSISRDGMTAGRWWEMKYSDLPYIRRIHGVETVGCCSYFFSSKAYDITGTAGSAPQNGLSRGNRQEDIREYDVQIMGITPDHLVSTNEKMLHGRSFNDLDLLISRKVCLLPSNLARKLSPAFVSLDELSGLIGKPLRIGNARFTIVGIFESEYQYSTPLYLPFTCANDLFNPHPDSKNDLLEVNVLCRKGADIARIESELRTYFGEKYRFAPEDRNALTVYNTEELMKLVNGLFGGIRFLTWFVGLGSLLAGVVGISNIMLITVRERRQEIGVRRAMGATPRDIKLQVIAESTLLGLLSGAVGMALAMIVQLVLGQAVRSEGLPPNTFQLSWGMAFLSGFIILVSSIISGILPAIKAIEAQPVDALREE